MQQFSQVIMEQYEQETSPSVQLEELEDDQVDDEIDDPEYAEIEQETQSVPELEAPPPPIVTNNQPSGTILSTLKVKESSQIMVNCLGYLLIKLFYELFKLLI